MLEKAAGDGARLDAAYAASRLPDEPDAESVEALVIDLQERFLWKTLSEA